MTCMQAQLGNQSVCHNAVSKARPTFLQSNSMMGDYIACRLFLLWNLVTTGNGCTTLVSSGGSRLLRIACLPLAIPTDSSYTTLFATLYVSANAATMLHDIFFVDSSACIQLRSGRSVTFIFARPRSLAVFGMVRDR